MERNSTICTMGSRLEALAKWKNACVTDVSISNHKMLRKCKDKPFLKAIGLPVEQEDVFVMRNCHHNDITALQNRYLKETPKMSISKGTVTKYCDELIELLLPHMDTYNNSVHSFVMEKKGKLRQRYLSAMHALKKDGFDFKRDSGIKMFIKNERYNEVKPPRAIMGRDPKFNILYSMFTTSIEHALMNLPQICKGKNFLGRGRLFQQIMSKKYVEIDYSKFEGSQRAKLLVWIEKYILNKLYPGNNLVNELFCAKMYKDGSTCNGVKFSFFGTRGSGDMDTGLFNTILNWIACRYYEDVNNTGGKGRFIVDGDDGVIGVNNLLATNINTAIQFGFDAKIILRDDYHDVEFCSSKFIEIDHGVFYQVQNMKKLLNNVQYVINSEFYECLPTYYGSLGFMYKQLYKNIPVYYEFAKYLSSCYDGYVSTVMCEKFSYIANEAFKANNHEFRVNPALCKAEISIAFGLDHGKIDELQDWFSNHKLVFPQEVSKKFNCRSRTKYADISLSDCNNIEAIFVNSRFSKQFKKLVKLSTQ